MIEFDIKPQHLVTRSEAYELISMDKRLFKMLFDQVDGPKPVGYYSLGKRHVLMYDPDEVLGFFKRFKQSRQEADNLEESGWAIPAQDMYLKPVFKNFLRRPWVAA
jgi:hypothetical protein